MANEQIEQMRYWLQQNVTDKDGNALSWVIHTETNEPFTDEQIESIFNQESRKARRGEFLKMQSSIENNLKFSDLNLFKLAKEETDDIQWATEMTIEIRKDKPDFNKIQFLLGDSDEDKAYVEKLKIQHVGDRQSLVDTYDEFLDECLQSEAIAFSSGMKREAQTEENQEYGEERIDAEEFKEKIINGEDLNQTAAGPTDESNKIENYYDPNIIGKAKGDVKSFRGDLEVDQIFTMNGGNALGVAETELTRKLVKKEMIGMIEQMEQGGTISLDESNQIMNYYWGIEQSGKLLAFRLNPTEIESRISNLMQEVMGNLTGQESPDDLNTIEESTLTIAVGSVIAHEAQHAKEMSMEESRTSEGSAEDVEKGFLTAMLDGPYNFLRQYIKVSGEPDQPIENQMQQDAQLDKWMYRI
jgi:hypothetical protein